jgi:hypothetical protein
VGFEGVLSATENRYISEHNPQNRKLFKKPGFWGVGFEGVLQATENCYICEYNPQNRKFMFSAFLMPDTRTINL